MAAPRSIMAASWDSPVYAGAVSSGSAALALALFERGGFIVKLACPNLKLRNDLWLNCNLQKLAASAGSRTQPV
jgi:hypothetical protein